MASKIGEIMKAFKNICLLSAQQPYIPIVQSLIKNNISFTLTNTFDSQNLNLAIALTKEQYLMYGPIADYTVCPIQEVFQQLPHNEKLLSYEQFIDLVDNEISPRSHQAQDIRLIEKLIRFELTKLGIPKTYAGYKYLIEAMNIYATRPSQQSILERSIERDMFRLMTRCWNENKNFRTTITPYLIKQGLKLNSKNILICLRIYINNVI